MPKSKINYKAVITPLGNLGWSLTGTLLSVLLAAVFFFLLPSVHPLWAIFLLWVALSLVFSSLLGYWGRRRFHKKIEVARQLLVNAKTEKELREVERFSATLPYGAEIRTLLGLAREKTREYIIDRDDLSLQLSLSRQEITARGQALEHCNEELDLFFSRTPVPMFRSSTAGRFIKVNMAFANLLDFDSPEFLMEEVWNIGLAVYASEKDRRDLLRSVQVEHEVVKDIMFRRRNGEEFLARVHARSLLGAQGQQIGLQGYVLDLSLEEGYKKVSEELERAKSASETKTHFLSKVSYRLRAPLHTFLGVLDLLDSKNLDVEQHSYVLLLKKSAQEVSGITNDILDLTRLELGTFTLDLAPFNLVSFIDDICTEVKPTADAHGLNLNCTVLGQLPKMLKGDIWRLRQILMHLLDNAIKFTNSGTVELTVERDPEQLGKVGSEFLFFQVRDSGVGMDDSVLERVFDPFYRGDTAQGLGHEGSGLGLSICRSLIEAMGGNIRIDSKPEKGTTVRFSLRLGYISDAQPYVVDDSDTSVGYVLEDSARVGGTLESLREGIVFPVLAQEENTEPEALELILIDDDRELSLGASSNKEIGLNILLVEDSPNNRLLFSLFLRELPHKLTEATNGQEAIECFNASRFDIIFMDMEMPLLDGFQATKIIRATELSKKSVKTPIVALTAQILPGSRERCLEAGCDEYIPKPFDLESIKRILKKYSVQPVMDSSMS